MPLFRLADLTGAAGLFSGHGPCKARSKSETEPQASGFEWAGGREAAA